METGRQGDRTPFGLLVSLSPCLLVFALQGCRSCEHVEAELRNRENEVRDLRAELSHTTAVNQALQNELHGLQQSHSAKVAAEPPAAYSVVSDVVLGRQTGGYDADHLPGDEALQIVLEPRDPAGHVIRAAGSVRVEAFEAGAGGRKAPLCSWDISPAQLQHAWRPGLWSTSYYLILAWKAWPSSDRVTVVVEFTAADGRVFQREKTFPIRPVPASQRKQLPATDSEEPSSPLPPPRKVDPAAQPGEARGAAPAPLQHWTGPAPLITTIELLKPQALDNPWLDGRRIP